MGAAQRGAGNHAWKHGVRANTKGYVWRWVPDHPDADYRGRVLEHRLVMEEAIGRRLTTVEVVHHINRVRCDNSLDNLQLLPNQAAHALLHQEDQYLGASS